MNGWRRQKQKGIRVRSQHGALVCVRWLRTISRKRKPFQYLSDLEEKIFETNHPVYFWC